MSTDFFRRAFLTLNDLIGMVFFAAMLNLSMFSVFMLSPAFLVLMPLFGLTWFGLAVVQARHFALSLNANMEGYLKVVSRTINAVLTGLVTASMLLFVFLAIISGGSPVIFGLVGFMLVNAPLLLIASTSLALLTQGFLLGLSLLRLLESPKNSAQESHFLQASLGYFFDTLTSSNILITVLFFLFMPLAPYVITSLAVASLALLTANIAWRFAPISFTNWIKLSFKTPIEIGVCSLVQEVNNTNFELKIADSGARLFTAPDHLSTIKGICSAEWEKKYLIKNIDQKLITLNTAAISEKNASKLELLSQIKDQLNSDSLLTPINKKNLVTDSPEVFNSFWREKGEIESIADAFNWYCDKDETVLAANRGLPSFCSPY